MRVVALEQDAELVAGDARDHRVGAALDLAPHHVGDTDERGVAGLVAADVVDLLEVVEVAEHEREVAAAIDRLGDGALEPVLERAPVREAGQRILVGELGHAREHLGAADRRGELPGDRAEEAHVARGERRLAGVPGGVYLTPHAVGEHDRHRDGRHPAAAPEQLAIGLVVVGVVDVHEVRVAVLEHAHKARVVGQVVDLVGREALLALGQLADVDQAAQLQVLELDPADRQRAGVERTARLLGGGLDDVVEPVHRSDGRGDRDQRAQLGLEARLLTAAVGLEHGRERVVDHVALLDLVGHVVVGALDAGDEGVDHVRVELGAGVAAQLGERLRVRQRAPVRAVGYERVPGVAGEHDARGERDLLAGDAVRVAAAVPALVLVADRVRHRGEAGQRPQDALADDGVLAHQLPLLGVEPAGLVEDLVGDPDLADVVEQRDRADLVGRAAVQAEAAGDRAGELVDLVGVAAGVAVARLEGGGQRADDGAVGVGRAALLALDVAQHRDERLLALHEAGELVAFGGSVEPVGSEVHAALSTAERAP